MRSAMSVASAVGLFAFATAEGRAATSCMICGRGSMASPKNAVTSDADASDAAPEKTACVLVVCAVYVPRKRKMAEGFSFESLAGKSELIARPRTADVLTCPAVGSPSLAKKSVRLPHIHPGMVLQRPARLYFQIRDTNATHLCPRGIHRCG